MAPNRNLTAFTMTIRPLAAAPSTFASRARAVLKSAGALLSATARPRGRRAADDTLVLAGRNDGPPDLDELWRDLNRKLSGLFGGRGGG